MSADDRSVGRREFFEVRDTDDPRLIEIPIFLLTDRQDMGKKRWAFRPWPTWRRTGVVLLINIVLGAGLVLFWQGPSDARVLAFFLPWIVGFTYFLCAMLGVLAYRQRVCENGLVVCGLNTALRNPPFVYWLIGTPHPEKLAARIERAMCDFGLEAEGLAAHASRTAVRAHRGRGKAGAPLLPPVRGLFDPVVGVARTGG